MYISPQPTFRLSDLLSKDKRTSRGGKKIFTADGRSALVAGLKVLGVTEGDTVLIPAYICKIIPSLLKKLGIAYKYYLIREDLSIDIDFLKKMISSGDSKAILFVHYFGFLDPLFDEISKLCRDKRLDIIEDCVHALYSRTKGRNFGMDGNVGIFSLHKALGTPAGGMLTINLEYGDEYGDTIELEEMPFMEKAVRIGKSLVYVTEKIIGFSVRPYLLSLKPLRRVIRKGKGNDLVKGYAIDPISLKVYEKTEEAVVVKKQRENFNYILCKISEYNLIPLYIELPEGVSPFGFPVILNGRDRIQQSLYRKGFLINALWDELPEDIDEIEFPASHYLRQRILILPVHRDIERRDIDAILKTIGELQRYKLK